ncbi:hypothetical protein LTR78_003255 [Recurvomyces mirabilis]|uniref:P-loop containing nucleoside triphosphate hydrolase protein n=1 Tax=Recurvomyces mirabilis TaxID=574656 RepID=A0AAE0WSZ4_9PEZI|nr:hypothetical protein LTR78_003255 [Recurvomyces mirabilis]KAK5156928.1 hypothetical protein LTS14_004445 [Recurvomyces mirabilis]
MSASNAADAAKTDDLADDWDAQSDDDDEAPAPAPVTANATSTQAKAGAQKDEEDDDDEADSEGTSSDDEDGEDTDARVLNSYRKLLSRRVDLVGDYAGDELFIIEGDSLLLRCFSDRKLDFSPGFQMLHATYNVEHLLHNLVTRKCNFHIVFFDCNRDLCVPPTAKEEDVAKFHFARAALIRHLSISLPKSHPEVMVKNFDSYASEAFNTYLTKTGPYFLMMHDGAYPIEQRGTESELPSAEAAPTSQRVALRRMILQFIARKYNIALMNGLEWRDTKVMTIVLEARHRANAVGTSALTVPTVPKAESQDASDDMSKVGDVELSARELLAVLAVSRIMRSPPADIDAAVLAKLCCLYLLHVALLSDMPLASRRVASNPGLDGAQQILRSAASMSAAVLTGTQGFGKMERSNDIADSVDGRLYLHLTKHAVSPSSKAQSVLDELLSAVEQLSSAHLVLEKSSSVGKSGMNGHNAPKQRNADDMAVLPFSNSVFDKHLEPVRLHIDDTVAGQQTAQNHRIFQELTHWHNAKKPIIKKGPPTKADEKQAFWVAKREQLFMAEMRTYAASLTNAVGKSLEPEVIIVGGGKAGSKSTSAITSPADSDVSDSGTSTTNAKGGVGKKGSGSNKNVKQNQAKQAMLANIKTEQAKKEGSAADKIVKAWQVVCKALDLEKETRLKFRKAKDYVTNLQATWQDVLEAEVRLYMLNCVLQYWIDAVRRKEHSRRVEVTALIWNLAESVMKSKGLTKAVAISVELTVKTLDLPAAAKAPSDPLSDRKLAFTFALPAKLVDSLAIGMPSKDFQLTYCGPYMERSFDSKPDSRVAFQPDGWQRKVLDGIDKDQSVFVVAPTSAGKTFISFYAMRKVLEADDDGVLVYVAPTKALVNQIAAEIQARYTKNFKYGGKSVWAIHTRDYRINNPTGCQVLVTVPHVLQIMLLAPSNANGWASRVRRIIFDEVHSIGQAEDGVVWEQLLLMSPCPIIALSATVGNPGDFGGWLTDTQKAIGIDLITVQHPHRYSDLRKYYYVPPKQFVFDGIPDRTTFGVLGLEGLTGFNNVHPVGALVDRSRGVPADLGLEPRDCFELWKAMNKLQTADYAVPAELNPAKALPTVCRKIDILNWEKELKALLKSWLAAEDSPYEQLVNELEESFRLDDREAKQTTQALSDSNASTVDITDPADLHKTTLPMLCRLHAHDALPAILFNYDRHQCEKICQVVLQQLQDAELSQRKSGPKWEKTLERWEEWKKVQLKNAKTKASGKKGKLQDEDQGSKLDQQRDTADAISSPWDTFSPEAPIDGFHFADYTRVQLSELQIYIKQLGKRNIIQWLIDALQRGVGVHHAGMNRKYRQVVEILFRKGFLRVIIATGTLALGINMPCKTVVFSGDSVFLTALNYRQCAGRAGRRGFDLLGNVVFQGVSREKVCRLISSRLPDLSGHFPITTTLVLRLFTLLHESKNSKYAVGAINALLAQPRLYMGGPSFKDQTMHHLRFSIEYLRRQHLLAPNGAPLNFAGLVSHLYFTENSSFAFHALLKEGYFHDLCGEMKNKEKDTVETLMLVMSHLFNRIFCRQADVEYREKMVKPSSSIVFLPPLPKRASEILRQHNQQTLAVYRTYVETFVDQHVKHDDRKLPLTGMNAGADVRGDNTSIDGLPAVKTRSPFVALSGAGDDFDTVHDLCATTRDGVFLEEAVIPHVSVYPDEMELPLNAWLLDFFKHGDVMTIEKANGIRRSDIWFLLNDFSLVLATIITSLLNFMKLREGTDLDMLDVMGDLDAHDEAEDNEVAASEDNESTITAPSVADSVMSVVQRPAKPVVTTKKAKKLDSWEDAAEQEEDASRREDRRAANAAKLQAEVSETLQTAGGSGEDLKDVLKAFQKLHTEFNVKFRAMWA